MRIADLVTVLMDSNGVSNIEDISAMHLRRCPGGGRLAGCLDGHVSPDWEENVEFGVGKTLAPTQQIRFQFGLLAGLGSHAAVRVALARSDSTSESQLLPPSSLIIDKNIQ